MRVVFCGTPEIAVPSLRAAGEDRREIVAVLTQPDRPAGRGLHTKASAVKTEAARLDLPVLAPPRPRDVRAELEALRPDVIVVVAYGHIFRPWLLALPPHGCINVHFSLLPRHRGPAPVAWAILCGDAETGVTTMRLDEGVDTGPWFDRERLAVLPDDTQTTLGARLAEAGARVLRRTLAAIADGAEPSPQPEAGVTHARMLTAEDGRVDWSRPAVEIARQVRGLDPWPGAFTTWRGRLLKIRAAAAEGGDLAPGELRAEGERLLAGTGGGILVLRAVQPEGKPILMGDAWARGARPAGHERLGR